jgi:hypothetical protein
MECINCGSQLEPNWKLCPHCGKFKSVLKEPVTEEAVEVIFGNMMGRSEEAKGQPSDYGSGVRGQVFEVIVRQALAGAPWREICAGPMEVNKIRVEDIETEVQRRRKILMDAKAFKKAKDEKSRKDKDAKKVKKTPAQSHDIDENPWGLPPAPPRPLFEKPDTLNSATARLQKLYKQLDEFLENAVQDKSQKEYSDKMVAELHDIIDSVMKLETLLYSIQTEAALRADMERELRRTIKPIDPEEPDDPHRINW